MTKKKQETEELIFEAASRVFKRTGYAGARMQEIADEANINKSMLHYYFRSKDKLFQKVFQTQIGRFFPVIFKVMGADDPLDVKVQNLIDAYYNFLQDNPNITHFVVIEMNNHPEEFQAFMRKENIRPPKGFSEQVKKEIEKGNLAPVDPRQLLVSIIGLILFPFIAQMMVKSIFGLNEKGFMDFMRERKEFLTDFILNAVNYKPS